MRDVLEMVETAVLLGATFSFALLIEWAALQAFFRVITMGLRPAVSPVPAGDLRKPQH